MNPWHDIEIGDKAPEVVTALVEIPKGSKTKFELDKDSGLLKVDRVLHSAVHYPAHYGFIPQSFCDDKDPLDVLILGQAEVYPLSLIEVRPIGYMGMIDGGEGDDKVIAVHKDDPMMKEINDISDLPQHLVKEIRHFFETYKDLEGKKVEITGFHGKAEALKIVVAAKELYQKMKHELIKK